MAPRTANVGQLSPQDYYDGFSTLFAVKAPDFPAGYDLAMLPLSELLRQVVEGRPGERENPSGHFVYLRDDQDSERRRVEMPEIPIGDAEILD